MGGNTVLELKYHVLHGRLTQAKKLLAASQVSLEEAADEDGNTALHWLAQALTEPEKEASEQEMLAFLLQNGAPKNRQNCLGETPLMSAVRLAILEPAQAAAFIEDLLVKARVDPSRGDLVGETPLMEAAASGLEGIGRLLLEHRANPLAESDSGLTAAKLAEQHQAPEFLQLLKSPLAERASQEAKKEDSQGRTMEDRRKFADLLREKQAKKFDQTLFGQKLRPGLAHDKDGPGKPYAEPAWQSYSGTALCTTSTEGSFGPKDFAREEFELRKRPPIPTEMASTGLLFSVGCLAIGILGFKRTVLRGAEIIQDAAEDWEARRRRVQALAKSGIPAEKALRQIIAHLEDADEQVRRCALDAGVRLLIPPPPTEDMEPEEAAAACAARLAAQQSALGRELRGSVLKQLKSDKDCGVRQVALTALGQLVPREDEEVLAALQPCLADVDDDVRSAAAAALGRLAPREEEEWLEKLYELLEDDDEGVRLSSVVALGRLAPRGHRATCARLAQLAREEEEDKVRRAVASTLHTLRS
ncbi:unnamed protein product [Effrenium voratum]|uniref:Uncharacterized protein n=1 Tax=Effrenium voratum TaxID=2562239 RepID=A0AA36IHG2_9DINO|nr:unnamed protein product [Effrenium voratum]